MVLCCLTQWPVKDILIFFRFFTLNERGNLLLAYCLRTIHIVMETLNLKHFQYSEQPLVDRKCRFHPHRKVGASFVVHLTFMFQLQRKQLQCKAKMF